MSEAEEAKQLRDKYVFKIVPILNPDGVIVGNYRWSLSGQDLNRQWIGATSRVFPEIYFTKQMFRKTLDSRKIFLYIDIHGHSRKKNTFIYGWHNKGSDKKNYEKLFPLIFNKNHPAFSFEEWNFNICVLLLTKNIALFKSSYVNKTPYYKLKFISKRFL